MKRIASFALVLVAILWIVPMTSLAQAPQPYVVQQGDTGWELARQYYDNPTIWQRIVDMNEFLQEPGRVFTDTQGRIILRLTPGEQLQGLERLNVPAPTAVPITELVPPATPATVVETSVFSSWPWFIWVLVLGMLALVLSSIYHTIHARRKVVAHEREEREEREREMRQDPITSGTPYVPGGIAPTDTARLEHFFDEQATGRYANRNPQLDRATIRATRVGPIEEGTVVGEGMVGYLGGEMRPRRIETPLRAYQARYRFPDGTEEVLQCLQACMNPVAYGGETYRGFTFTPTQVVVPMPEPERPAPQPAPHPAIAVRRIREAAQVEGQNTITLGDEVMVFPLGYHLTVDRETNIIRLEANAVQMVLTPKPQAKVEAATGTSDK